jgi:hypothetical protein
MMRAMRVQRLLFGSVVFAAAWASACSVAPSAKSPLKERLESNGNAEVEASVRTCLKEGGWKVDDVGSYSGGANVVTAYKAKDQTDVYIYPPEQHPRITGGPDDGNPFWGCVARQLGGAGGGDEKAKDADKDKGDKDKPKDDKADKDKPKE